MIEENLKSKCCGAEVEVSTADDLGVTSGGTSCYMCKKCNKPCDLQPYEVDYPRNKALEIINEKADTNHKEMVEAVKGIKLAKQNMFDQYNKFMKTVEAMPEIIKEMEKVAMEIDWISKDEK